MKDHPRTMIWLIAAAVAVFSAIASSCAPVDFDSSSAPVYNTGSC